MNGRRAWLGVVILGAVFATDANAQTEIEKLRGCLTIEDGSKERLDCYDGIVPQIRNQNRQLRRWSTSANSWKRRMSGWVVSIAFWCSQRGLLPKPLEKPLRRLNRQSEPLGSKSGWGQTKVNGFKWTSNTRVLVGIIAALLLTIWLGLRLQYYW